MSNSPESEEEEEVTRTRAKGNRSVRENGKRATSNRRSKEQDQDVFNFNKHLPPVKQAVPNNQVPVVTP